MDAELIFVLGVVAAGFSIPFMIAAFSESRPPRVSAILVLIAGGLIIFAIRNMPSGFTVEMIPDVFIRVIARYVL